jgi:hypothetical protein
MFGFLLTKIADLRKLMWQGVAGIVHNNLSPTERLIVEPMVVGEFANFWL